MNGYRRKAPGVSLDLSKPLLLTSMHERCGRAAIHLQKQEVEMLGGQRLPLPETLSIPPRLVVSRGGARLLRAYTFLACKEGSSIVRSLIRQ